MSKMNRFKIFVNGAWLDPLSQSWFETINPFTGEPWGLVPECNANDVNRAVAAAREASISGPWPELTPSKRGGLLNRLGDLIQRNAERLARIETRDTGKRLAETLPQARYVGQWFVYYGGLADKLEGRVLPTDQSNIFNYTLREPLGVVAAITPWNSPLMIAAWKIAPALAAGNTVVIKPSEHASVSTIELMRLVDEAGFPPGVINLVTGYGEGTGMPLATHPDVAKVTFTGSETAGQSINVAAARRLKHVTMELGGKSPQIVFADADLKSAVNGVISGIFLSNGQTCVAGSRLYLHDTIVDDFVTMLTAAVKRLRMGDPTDLSVHIGPIANRPQFEKILSYLHIALGEGATIVCGGKASQRPECRHGLFIEPTILADVTSDMRVAREEIFGPVLSVMPFTTLDEVVADANDSRYGLAAGVWTRDLRLAHLVARRLQCGTVYVNNYRSVSFVSPVGGYKSSGFGRENGIEAIYQFQQTKSVWINLAEQVQNPFALQDEDDQRDLGTDDM